MAAERIEGVGLKRQVADAVVALATSDRVPVCVSGLQCLGSFMNKMADESSFVVGALKEVKYFSHITQDKTFTTWKCIV